MLRSIPLAPLLAVLVLVPLALLGCRRAPGVEPARISVETMRPPPNGDPDDDGLALWTRALQMVPPDAVYIGVTDLERSVRGVPYELPLPSNLLELIEPCGLSPDGLRLVAGALNTERSRLLLAAGPAVAEEGVAQCVKKEIDAPRYWVAIMGGEILVVVFNDWVDELQRRTRQAAPEPLHHAISTVPSGAAGWTYGNRASLGSRWPRSLRAMTELVMIVDTSTDFHARAILWLRPGAQPRRELERIARNFSRRGGPVSPYAIPNHLQDRIEIAAGSGRVEIAWTSSTQTAQSWKSVIRR